MRAAALALLLLTSPAYAATYAIDGDTISIDGERIRVMGVDAPETFQAKCADERAAGLRAKAFTAAALARGPVRLDRGRLDKYGRRLAIVWIGERDLAAMLIEAGLGREYHGKKRGGWC